MSDAAAIVKKARKAVVRADKAVTHRAARYRDTSLARIAGKVSEVADQPPLIALSAATIVAGRVLRRGDLLRAGVRMLAAELVATGVKTVVKKLVDRARPGHALDSGDQRFRPGDSDRHELNSFPSGHTAGAVAVARAATREVDGVAVPAALATGFIAVAQPPSGHHYLGDVVAGAAIGLAAEAVVDAAFGALMRRMAGPDRLTDPPPEEEGDQRSWWRGNSARARRVPRPAAPRRRAAR